MTTIVDFRTPQPYSGEKIPSVCDRVVIAIPGYAGAVQEYLETTGESINEQELILTALKLTKDLQRVDELLKQHITRAWLCYQTLAFAHEYTQLITEVVTALRDELFTRRLYNQNTLPYVCEDLLGNRLLLCSRSTYTKRIINELRLSEVYSL